MLKRVSDLLLIISVTLANINATEGIRKFSQKVRFSDDIVADSEDDDSIAMDDKKFPDDIRRILSRESFEKGNAEAVNETFISFSLFNTETYEMFEAVSEVSLENMESIGDFDPKNKLTFIVHDWIESRHFDWCLELTNVLTRRNETVIAVDWHTYAEKGYPVAAANTKEVGNILGRAIIEMKKIFRLPMEEVEIVGNGMGAHVAGFAGKYVQQQENTKILRIYALDPAGPLFIDEDKSNRLADADAQSVVVLHTDDGVFGYDKSIGSKDFYANGGIAPQPGCLDNSKLSLKVIVRGMLCSHRKAMSIFVIANMNFPLEYVGTECESYRNFVFRMCASNKKQSLLDENAAIKGTFHFQCEGGAR